MRKAKVDDLRRDEEVEVRAARVWVTSKEGEGIKRKLSSGNHNLHQYHHLKHTVQLPSDCQS